MAHSFPTRRSSDLATAAARVHDPAAPSALARLRGSGAGACGSSLCAMRDVVDAASSAASSAAASASADRDTAPLNRRRAHRAGSSSSSSAAGGGGGGSSHHSSLRGLSGCYECRAINVEPMSRSACDLLSFTDNQDDFKVIMMW